jgi:ABC-2 type transport system permease protein
MKRFLSLVQKEFCHIFRDTRTMIILLGMPVVQIILFGFALTNEVKNAQFAVLDLSKDVSTTAITSQLDASRYFDLHNVLHNYDDIERSFRRGDVKIVFVFPPQFHHDLLHFNKAQVQIVTDASDPNTANTLNVYASAVIRDYQDRLTNHRKLPYTINSEIRMLYNPQLKGAYSMVPGVMAMVLMLVCTMMTAITVVKEKETGTMEILLVSPVKPIMIIIAKAVPYLLLSFVNILSILLLSVFVLQVPINGSLALVIFESILFTLTCLAFGLLISASTDSQQTAMFISLMGMFLPTIMLSGFMFPIENMPMALQVISNIVPSKWYYNIINEVMIKGAGFSVVWKETLVLASFMILLLLLSVGKFKIRLA